MFGRMLNETLGKIHFFLTFVFFNLAFFPMHNLGLGGMMRRISDPPIYEHLRQLQPLNQISTVGAIGLGFTTFIFLWNVIVSLRNGRKAPANPWHSNTLEWTVPSPPGHGNFPRTPTVYHGPYEYSVPGLSKDYLPQTEKIPICETEHTDRWARPGPLRAPQFTGGVLSRSHFCAAWSGGLVTSLAREWLCRLANTATICFCFRSRDGLAESFTNIRTALSPPGSG
jgi:hypothetical protein